MKVGQSHAPQKEDNCRLLTMKFDAERMAEFICQYILLAILYYEGVMGPYL